MPKSKTRLDVQVVRTWYTCTYLSGFEGVQFRESFL